MESTSTRAGLTAAEAADLLRTVGPNQLPLPRRPARIVLFARQLIHFFAVLLWVASGLAWIAGLPALTVAIGAVVVFNAVFAFLQEHRAERAAERLEVLLPTSVTARRDHRPVRVDAIEIVPGDVVLLEAGDRVPADGSVVDATGGLLDSSMLTGESEAVPIAVGAPVFAGTFLVEGVAEVEVTTTGGDTRLARIAELTASTAKPATPLARELRRMVRVIALIAIGVGLAFLLVSWRLGRDIDEGVVLAIGVTVALVPEALLPTVTLSLAWGAEQMAERQVLPRS